MPSTDNAARSRASPQIETSDPAPFFPRRTRVERIGYAVAVLLLLSGFAHALILIARGASWEGPLSFRKPATFGLSFGLTLITIIWVSAFVRLTLRTRSLLLGTFTAACLIETSLVTSQTWRGVPSHFNVESTFDGVVARSLAVGGFTLIVVIGVLTYASFRTNPLVPVSMRVAIRVGFVALLGAQFAGAFMIARGMKLVFSGAAKAAYATAGALKPMHAVMMHGVLVLPALAWLGSRADWSEQRRTRLLLIATTGYLLMVAGVTLVNLASVRLAQLRLAGNALVALGILSIGATSLLTFVAVMRTRAEKRSLARLPWPHEESDLKIERPD